MKKLLIFFKNNDVKVPVGFGTMVSQIPFRYRPGIGKMYQQQVKAVCDFPAFSAEQKQKFIYDHVFQVFRHAYNNIPFYHSFYQDKGVAPSDILTFDDIVKIPILTKKDLIDVPLEERSYPVKGRTIVNTGGSSGKPLTFYMDAKRFGNEWSHIHHIWRCLGVSPKEMRLKFDGRNSVEKFIQYDFIRNMFRYNIYADPDRCADQLMRIVKKHKIALLHGYPSAIFNFALYCKEYNEALLYNLKKTLKGVHLVSEFPNPHFRMEIERTFEVPTISSYGHTETCVMAYEKEHPFQFSVLQTYGYAEAVKVSPDNYSLVGTSYFNYASPLIRYDTEDRIGKIKRNDEILEHFRISDGRKGEYILDRNNQKIPLTGLIFGRHHKLFDLCKYVQVFQQTPGQALILFVSDKISEAEANKGLIFDGSNVDIHFKFRKITNPILTKSGKLNLLVKNIDEK